jgi:oligopeptide transport system ATP-binding protein
MGAPLFALHDFSIRFETQDGVVEAVSGLDFEIGAGERVAIVGESGSGKSQTFLGALRLLAKNGRAEGEAWFGEMDLLALSPRDLDRIRGRDIAVVFQDSMTSLNPALRISRQLTEPLEVHRGLPRKEAEGQALDMLRRVGIADPERRFRHYPHQLFGGMRQRIAIAMALLTRPRLLIADEPTTALDVTIQAQILDLFQEMTAEMQAALVLITHDLGVVAGLADRVAVMYAGRIVEEAPVRAIFNAPKHPYTVGLLGSIPRVDQAASAVTVIPGRPPNAMHLPRGCAFAPRCAFAEDDCRAARPPLIALAPGHRAACFHPLAANRKEPADVRSAPLG